MDKLTKAKNIDILYFLNKNGIKPKKETGNRAYYLSPFRDETKPSFVVYKNENKFHDWGEDWHGDVIDIAERLWSCTTSDAIERLLKGDEIPEYHKKEAVVDRSPGIIIIESEENITNEALINYMENIRKIDMDVVNRYCEQVVFQFPSRKYIKHFGVGMKNDIGGWVIRGTWFKGSSSPAGITTIITKDTDECLLFEGFLDFLSYVVIFGEPNHTTIILNSTVFAQMIMSILQGFGSVHVWVDNDVAGDLVVEDLITNYVNVIDHRDVFSDYNDLNEKLQADGI